jgi:flagellar biosynthetic protein FlhB
MAEQSFEEKTEEPTPKKRQELKEKGEVAKSKELPSVAVLLAALISLSSHFYYSDSIEYRASGLYCIR